VVICHTENPFEAEGLWLKGALHAHTTESDGHLTPTELATLYRDRGWDFLFLTDHNKVTTLDEPVEGLLVLPGIEQDVGNDEPNKNWHLVGLCADDSVSIEGKFASATTMVEHQRPKVPFCMLAHPYWSQLSGKDVSRFDDIDAVEVWNTGCELGEGRGYAEYQWDWALASGSRLHGVAVDDCHSRIDDSGGGWVMVKAAACSSDAIIDALKRGMFYSTCGPEIHGIRLTEDALEVETSPCREIGFVADRQAGTRVLPEEGPELTSARYPLRGKEGYVRVQCTDALSRKAWSNPFYLQWPPEPEDETSGNEE